MLESILAVLFAVVLRILFGYLSDFYGFLESWIPAFNWIAIGVGVIAGLLLILNIVKVILSLKGDKGKKKEREKS